MHVQTGNWVRNCRKIAADPFSNGHNTAGNGRIETMSTPLELCVRVLKHDSLENLGDILPKMQCMSKTGNWVKNYRKIAADSFLNGHNTAGNGRIGTLSTPLESCVRVLKHDSLGNRGDILRKMQCMFKTGNWVNNYRKIAADSFLNGHNTAGNRRIGTMSTPLESCVRVLKHDSLENRGDILPKMQCIFKTRNRGKNY